MLDSPNGEKLFGIPDRLGNLPLMIAVIKGNTEYESLFLININNIIN